MHTNHSESENANDRILKVAWTEKAWKSNDWLG